MAVDFVVSLGAIILADDIVVGIIAALAVDDGNNVGDKDVPESIVVIILKQTDNLI